MFTIHKIIFKLYIRKLIPSRRNWKLLL